MSWKGSNTSTLERGCCVVAPPPGTVCTSVSPPRMEITPDAVKTIFSHFVTCKPDSNFVYEVNYANTNFLEKEVGPFKIKEVTINEAFTVSSS